MAAPSLVSQAVSTWTDIVSTDEVTTGSISWSTGDQILVVGWTEDNNFTLNTPTATGLTFAALGSPVAVGNTCWVHTWTATAGGTSSGAVTGPLPAAASAARGIGAFVYSGSTGFGGRSTTATPGTAQTVSLIRTGNNSAVVVLSADWSASGIGGLGWTPAGQTQDQASLGGGQATVFMAHWGDQGAAGTTSYGTTGLSGNKFSIVAVEILGTAGGATSSPALLDKRRALRHRLAR